MIELRHLRTLTALREHGSLVAAASDLCLTPSALSHQLRELDQWFGVEVVNRRSRPVSFSNVGERLLKLADEILPQVQIAQSDISRIVHGQTGRIVFSSECHSCFDWLMPLLNQYRMQYPDVDLDFASGFESNPHELLQTGEFDLLITADPIALKGIEYFPIFEYESINFSRIQKYKNSPFLKMDGEFFFSIKKLGTSFRITTSYTSDLT